MLKNIFSECAYAYSHGVDKNNLGLIPLYYSLAYVNQVKVAVVVGSGGGIVPMAFRQAQRDLKLEGSETWIVDGFVTEAGFGHPLEEGGWANESSAFNEYYPEIKVLKENSKNLSGVFKNIDILHIDAEHTYEAVIRDFETLENSLSSSSIVLFHDTQDSGVQNAVNEVTKKYDYEVLNFRDMASGLSIIRKSTKSGYDKNVFDQCLTRPDGHQWTLGPNQSKTWGGR